MNVQKKNLIVLSCAEEKKENDANFMKKITHFLLDWISLGFRLVTTIDLLMDGTTDCRGRIPVLGAIY